MFDTPEFQALRREYIQGVLERCAFLRGEAQSLRAGEVVDLSRLRQEIHKCRGSGGFYGFAALSAASAVAEDRLVAVLDGEAALDAPEMSGLVEAVVSAAEKGAADAGV